MLKQFGMYIAIKEQMTTSWERQSNFWHRQDIVSVYGCNTTEFVLVCLCVCRNVDVEDK